MVCPISAKISWRLPVVGSQSSRLSGGFGADFWELSRVLSTTSVMKERAKQQATYS
jgi:hypothetical protein